MFMSPYHVQIDSLFSNNEAFVIQGKQIYLLPLCVQKHEKYDLKNSFLQHHRAVRSHLSLSLFCLYQNEGQYGILIKIDINLGNAFSDDLET